MELRFERGPEVRSEQRHLPAETYNRLHVLFARSGRQALFVPIRPLQFLAAIDREEVVFVDGMNRHLIELAWQRFRPQARTDLHGPVAYRWVCYSERLLSLEQQLQGEFHKALLQLDDRQSAPAAAVTPLPTGGRGREKPE